MYKVYLYIILVLYLVFWVPLNYCQNNNLQKNFNSNNKVKVEKIVLNEIEEGIKKGDMSKLTDYFSSQPYISLLNGVNGYYSSNQVYYILEDFFRNFKVVSFNFENKKFEDAVVYGTGIYFYESKGKRESAYLYVTLNKVINRWKISQISIN